MLSWTIYFSEFQMIFLCAAVFGIVLFHIDSRITEDIKQEQRVLKRV